MLPQSVSKASFYNVNNILIKKVHPMDLSRRDFCFMDDPTICGFDTFFFFPEQWAVRLCDFPPKQPFTRRKSTVCSVPQNVFIIFRIQFLPLGIVSFSDISRDHPAYNATAISQVRKCYDIIYDQCRKCGLTTVPISTISCAQTAKFPI